MESENKFEQAWREAFQGAEMEPSEALWLRIEKEKALLQNSLMQQRVRRYKRVVAVCLLALVGMVSWIAIQKNQVKDERNQTISQATSARQQTKENLVEKISTNKSTNNKQVVTKGNENPNMSFQKLIEKKIIHQKKSTSKQTTKTVAKPETHSQNILNETHDTTSHTRVFEKNENEQSERKVTSETREALAKKWKEASIVKRDSFSGISPVHTRLKSRLHEKIWIACTDTAVVRHLV